eukprot:scaffold54331_cov20-Tisochrysis_lutea.AAC.2
MHLCWRAMPVYGDKATLAERLRGALERRAPLLQSIVTSSSRSTNQPKQAKWLGEPCPAVGPARPVFQGNPNWMPS